RRFNLKTQTPEIQFSIGNGLQVEDMEVAPGNPNLVAVSRTDAGVSIFENGLPKPVVTSGPTFANSIVFSDSPTRLFGYDNESSAFALHQLSVDATGVVVLSSTPGLVSGYGENIEFAGGLIYATTGAVIDSSTLKVVGRFSGPGLGVFDGVGY